MKTTILRAFYILFSFGISISSLAQGWTQLTDFPSSARDDGTSFTLNEITYCGTGLNESWNPTNDFYAFDMTNDSWTPIAGLPSNEARQYANGFSSGNTGFIFGGLNGTGYLNDVWAYDPTADSWSIRTPMPAVGRSGASCFVIGDTAYIMGGQTATNQSLSEVWAYSMNSDTWTQKNPLPDSLWRASATSYQDQGYLLFGRDNAGNYKNALYAYSPTTDSWNSLSNFPGVGRTYSGLVVLNDKLVSFAGRDSLGNSYNDLWEYSPSSDVWSLSVNLPSAQRRGGICFSSNSGLYYTTGINLNDVRLSETWKYDLFLGIEDSNNEAISIYPNPSRDQIQIRHALGNGKFIYRIASVLGKIVQSGESAFESMINVSQLKPGNYFITIQTESNTFTKKIMIY